MKRSRSDGNQEPIVKHLRSRDWDVAVTSQVKDGFPDLVCARMGFTALLELKVGNGALNDDQVRFHAKWSGVVLTANSPEDALAKLNAALVRSGACKLEDLGA